MHSILFDLDGTILDRNASLLKFLHWQVSSEMRFALSQFTPFIERFIELDEQGRVWKDVVYRQLIEEFDIDGWSAEELTESYVLNFCNFCTARQGIPEAVKLASQCGLKIGLVSNGKSPFQERNFNSLKFSHLFDDIIVSEAVGLRKPDRRIFELACRNLGTEPGSCIFVGDNPIADIKGAKLSGMRTIYLPDAQNAQPCEHADVDCREPGKLPDYIAAMLSA